MSRAEKHGLSGARPAADYPLSGSGGGAGCGAGCGQAGRYVTADRPAVYLGIPGVVPGERRAFLRSRWTALRCFLSLTAGLERLAYGAYCSELALSVAQTGQPATELYALLLATLTCYS